MIRKTVHHLRGRPHHERRAVAAGVAIFATCILLVGWFAFIVRNLGADSGDTYAAQGATSTNVAAAQVSQAAPAPVATSAAPVNIPAGGWLTDEPTTTIQDYLNTHDSSVTGASVSSY